MRVLAARCRFLIKNISFLITSLIRGSADSQALLAKCDPMGAFPGVCVCVCVCVVFVWERSDVQRQRTLQSARSAGVALGSWLHCARC